MGMETEMDIGAAIGRDANGDDMVTQVQVDLPVQ